MPTGRVPLELEHHVGRRRRYLWPTFVLGIGLGLTVGIAVMWLARCAA